MSRTTAARLSAVETQQIAAHKARPLVINVSAVRLNRFAMDSNVITALIAGKQFTFVGQKAPRART